MTCLAAPRLLLFKALGLSAAMIGSAMCTAADLAVTRSQNAAGPQVRIEVQTSYETGPRTVTVPRDLTVVDRKLPGSDSEYTDGTPAQYYGIIGCDWSGLRTRLKAYLESNTRESLIFTMRNYLNDPRGGLGRKLDYAFGMVGPGRGQYFFGVGGNNGLFLNEPERQRLRDGQPVIKPDGNFPDNCIVPAQEARQLLESAIRVYESYTGVSRNQ